MTVAASPNQKVSRQGSNVHCFPDSAFIVQFIAIGVAALSAMALVGIAVDIIVRGAREMIKSLGFRPRVDAGQQRHREAFMLQVMAEQAAGPPAGASWLSPPKST
jgi:hypothetical protein